MQLKLKSTAQKARATQKRNLRAAVHRHRTLSKQGFLERSFTLAFRGLVYPQIWEDPAIDLEALQITPDSHVVTIASGGCNVMSYLVADPRHITAVDLNAAHIALNRLKLCAAANLPDYDSFFRFFGEANQDENVEAYERYIKPHLDITSRVYWESRNLFGRKRIGLFSRNLYRYGLLGHCIGMFHFVARLYGRDPRELLDASSLEEQRIIFEQRFAPIFDKRFIRWMTKQPASLFGLGIPPAQYRALASSGSDGITSVLRARLERLACDFDIKNNYFAWQAFGRGYGSGENAPVPPYLERENFDAVHNRAARVDVRHVSFSEFLKQNPAQSVDRYVLLDAQDWMNDADLTTLWTEITRTAKPGARVIFRTAAEPSLLPGRVPEQILSQWDYDADYCRELTNRDRSSIYGGFHLYSLRQPG
jgi:S-adenosylmethionine-diacylglycerol 3-amino-3-carboxypropyl transferase